MLFRLNLIADDDTTLDEEGVELPSLETACFRALREARAIIAEEARCGVVPLSWRIEVTDEDFEVLAVMPFAQAVTLH